MADTPPADPPAGDEAATNPPEAAEAAGPAAGSTEGTGFDPASAAEEPGVPAPDAPTAPEPPEVAAAPPGRGQRRITRETHTTTSRSQSEATTHETSTTVEDIAVVAPVYAAPTSEHPRPVG